MFNYVWVRTLIIIDNTVQGGHGTGNLAVNFSRQGKHREFSKFNFLHRENCGNMENLEFFENFAIKVATR